MQGGIIGSLYFLAFLLSFGKTQNLEEFKSGLQEDEFESNDGAIYTIHVEEHDDADKRSRLFSEPNLIYPNNYGNLIKGSQQNPSIPFDLWTGAAINYGESYALPRAQNIASDFSSNYATAEADANSQALAELSSYNSPYKTAYLDSNLVQAQANTQTSTNAILGYGKSALSPSYSTSLARAQAIAPNTGSSYTDMEADDLAQAIISGLNFDKHESNSFKTDSLAHSEANFQPQTQGNAQKQTFSSEVSSSLSASAEADALAKAHGLTLGGPGTGSSPIGLEYPGSGFSSAEANAQRIESNSGQELSSASFITQPKMSSDSNLDFGPGSIIENAHVLANAQVYSSEESGKLATANAFAGMQSRVIPHDQYILPHVISGGENIICSKAGELHNVRSEEYECLICACVSEYGYLSPVCVKCDLCSVPALTPPSLIPIQPSPPTPEQIIEFEVSCDPLPTNTPFQNPLNLCQICICQYSFGLEPDVRITCEESPSCVTSNDLVIIPPIPDPPAPVPMPTCEKFPPNVIFPHPFDICQSCECVVSESYLSEHKIVCYPTPGCEPIPVPSPTPLPEPETLPWPPVPSGPLPGPPPHKSCAPYPPNQQFQHPWDDCQICVCNEIYSIDVINIEVNCFTNPVCCRDYPAGLPQSLQLPMKEALQITMESLSQPAAVPEPVSVSFLVDRPVSVPPSQRPVSIPQLVPHPSIPYPLIPELRPPVQKPEPQHMPYPAPFQHSVTIQRPYPVDRPVPEWVSVAVPHTESVMISQPKLLDAVCQFREVGVEFQYNKCRICSCQIFGSVLVPVCRRPNRPECVTLPAAVPVGNVVYIEPRCRYRQPLQAFTSDCQSCVCQSVFNYVVAKCIIMPRCGQSQYLENSNTAEANAIANAQTGSFFNHLYGFGQSQSSAEANAAASSGSSGHGGYPFITGSSGSSFAEAEALANLQSGSKIYGLTPHFNSYPHYGDQTQATAEAEAVGAFSFYPSLYPKPHGQITPLYIPGGSFGHAQSLAEAIADSNASGLSFAQGSGLSSGRPRIKSGNPEDEETEDRR